MNNKNEIIITVPEGYERVETPKEGDFILTPEGVLLKLWNVAGEGLAFELKKSSGTVFYPLYSHHMHIFVRKPDPVKRAAEAIDNAIGEAAALLTQNRLDEAWDTFSQAVRTHWPTIKKALEEK